MGILAYIFAFLKNVIFGTTNFFIKDLDGNDVDTIDILALRFLLSFLILWLLKTTGLLSIKVGIKDVFKKTERHRFIKPLLLTALFSPVIEMLFETVGATNTTAVTAGVIISLSPIFTCVFEGIILKESTTKLQKMFLAIGVVGVIYVAIHTNTNDGENTMLGILCLLVAVMAGPLHLVFSRQSTKKFAPFEISYFACLFGTVFFNFINVIKHLYDGDILHYFDPYLDVKNIPAFVMLSLFATIIATGLNNYAISRLQASTISAFGGVTTAVTILMGVAVLGEELQYYHYIGFTLIIIRIVGVSLIESKKEKKKLEN